MNFKILTVCTSDDVKYVNTNKETTITEIDDIQNINIDGVELEHNIVEGQCTGSDVKRKTYCTLSNNIYL